MELDYPEAESVRCLLDTRILGILGSLVARFHTLVYWYTW